LWGIRHFNDRIKKSGYIYVNSWRGVRGYWYHTLGVNSALSYSLLAKEYGVNLFEHPKLKKKYIAMIEKTILGSDDIRSLEVDENNPQGPGYLKFQSKGFKGHTYSTDLDDERWYIHQDSVNLIPIAKEEYNLDAPVGIFLNPSKPVPVSAGFNATCYYESNFNKTFNFKTPLITPVKEAEMPVVEFYMSLDSKQKECTEKIIGASKLQLAMTKMLTEKLRGTIMDKFENHKYSSEDFWINNLKKGYDECSSL
jgi:hypothetical protein